MNLFKDNRKLEEGFKLQQIVDQSEVITMDALDVDDVEDSRGYCLLAGRFPGKRHHSKCATNGSLNITISFMKVWLIFKFETEASKASVLHGGLYFGFGRSLMLKINVLLF